MLLADFIIFSHLADIGCITLDKREKTEVKAEQDRLEDCVSGHLYVLHKDDQPVDSRGHLRERHLLRVFKDMLWHKVMV